MNMVESEGVLMATGESGIMRSTDNGEHWEWVISEGRSLPKDDRYKEVRTWYARDHGITSLSELLDIMEGAELSAPAG